MHNQPCHYRVRYMAKAHQQLSILFFHLQLYCNPSLWDGTNQSVDTSLLHCRQCCNWHPRQSLHHDIQGTPLRSDQVSAKELNRHNKPLALNEQHQQTQHAGPEAEASSHDIRRKNLSLLMLSVNIGYDFHYEDHGKSRRSSFRSNQAKILQAYPSLGQSRLGENYLVVRNDIPNTDN